MKIVRMIGRNALDYNNNLQKSQESFALNLAT